MNNLDIMEYLQFMNISFDKFWYPGRIPKQLPLLELKFKSCFDSYIGVKLTPTHEPFFISLDVELS